MRFALSIAMTLIAATATAAVVDRRPLADPPSTLAPLAAARIVAGGHGDFLVHARRVSSEGVLLDSNPIPGASGFAVSWADGWLIMPSPGTPFFRKLTADGQVERLMQIAHRGQLVDATSGHGRFALLERDSRQPPGIWITVGDEEGIIEQREITRANTAAIVPFVDGFLLVTSVRATQQHSLLHAWRLDRNGIPLEVEEIGTAAPFAPLSLVAREDRALLAYTLIRSTGSSAPAVRTIEPSLHSPDPIELIAVPSGPTVTRRSIVAVDDGFLVSYSVGSDQHRALLVGRDGTRIADVLADPIGAVDRFENRYLIMRPWGDVAIALDDPRLIASTPFTLQEVRFPASTMQRTVISGDVTMVIFRDPATRFVRADANGTPIDAAPQPFARQPNYSGPNAVTATPEGFAFVSWQNGTFFLHRLERHGSWLADPLPLAESPSRRAFDIHANGSDLLFSWTTPNELLWQRFAFDGTQLDTEPRRLAYSTDQVAIGISGGNGNRLILSQHIFICPILCPPIADRLDVLAIGPDGAPLGGLTSQQAFTHLRRATALPDLTWIVPVETLTGNAVLHLDRDGSLLGEYRHPLLARPDDIASTALGWRAIMQGRLIEFIGPDRPVGLIGLRTVAQPRFAFGNLIAFVDEHPTAPASVASIGRLETRPGDLSLRVTEITAAGLPRRFQIEVTNHGPTAATNVYITATNIEATGTPPSFTFTMSGSSTALLSSLEPGQTVRLTGASHTSNFARTVRLFVLSEDVDDVRPEDNVVDIPWVTPPASTRRRLVGTGG